MTIADEEVDILSKNYQWTNLNHEATKTLWFSIFIEESFSGPPDSKFHKLAKTSENPMYINVGDLGTLKIQYIPIGPIATFDTKYSVERKNVKNKNVDEKAHFEPHVSGVRYIAALARVCVCECLASFVSAITLW